MGTGAGQQKVESPSIFFILAIKYSTTCAVEFNAEYDSNPVTDGRSIRSSECYSSRAPDLSVCAGVDDDVMTNHVKN